MRLCLIVFVLLAALAVCCGSVRRTAIQSPKGAALFPTLGAVVRPVLTMVNSNEITGVILAWNAVPGTNVAGYKVYYGINSGFYTNALYATTNAKTHSVNLNLGVCCLNKGTTYFFAATAFDTSGLESDFSNELMYSVPFTYNTVTLRWSPAGTNLIQNSTDLKTWNNLATTTPPFTKSRDKKAEFFRLKTQ